MTPTTDPAELEISPFDRILGEYWARTDSGEDVPLGEFLDAHADFRDEVLAFLKMDAQVRVLGGCAASGDTSNAVGAGTAFPGLKFLQAGQRHPADLGANGFEPQQQLLPGPFPVQFGQYRIVGLLGQGAMGEVYEAEDARLGRKVAIKMPRRQVIAQPEILSRFLREARATARLRHHNLCPIYEVATADGIPYIAMAYIDGKPLSSMIGKYHRHAPRQVADTVRKIAQALDVAHRAGVVHRDLKPANILIDADGEPIVMDFGLAHQAADESQARLTQDGMILGTPSYMPPEQVRCEHSRVGPASDVYSLGVILFELLTGRLPFAGPMMSMLVDVANEATSPPKPSALRPDISPRLEAVCLRMLAKPIEARFQSMQDVAAALAACLDDANDPLPGARSAVASTTAVLPPAPSTVSGTELLGTLALEPPAGPVAAKFPARSPVESPADQSAAAPTLSATAHPNSGNAAGRPPTARFNKLALGGRVAALLLAGVIVIQIRNRDGSTIRIEADDTAEISFTRQPDTPPGSKPALPAPAADDPDRRAAAWLRQERVEFDTIPNVTIRPGEPLPDTPFQIIAIRAGNSGLERFGDDLADALAEPLRGTRVLSLHLPRAVTPVGFQKLVALPALSELSLVGFQKGTLDDRMLVPLSKLPNLSNIGANAPHHTFTGEGIGTCRGLTDVTLVHLERVEAVLAENLAPLPKLAYLNLTGGPCGQKAAAALARLRLKQLLLSRCAINDAAAAELANAATLETLELHTNPLTDKGLTELHRLKRLRKLVIRETQVTAMGIAALRAALPDCMVESSLEDGRDSPRPAAIPDDPARRAAAWLQGEGAIFGVDLGFDVGPTDPLPNRPFRITELHGERSRLERFGDGLAEALAEPLHGNSVARLFLPQSVTAAGLEKLVALPEFSGLKGIWIAIDGLSDQMLVPLSKLSELADINAWRPSRDFTGKGIGACKGLTDLTLVELAEVRPALVNQLAMLPKLHYLNLSESVCKPQEAAAIARIPLTHLILNNAQVDDAVVAELADCATLESLSLDRNPLTDKGLAELHRLKRLRSLNLGKTEVTAAGVAALKAALPECEVEFLTPAMSGR